MATVEDLEKEDSCGNYNKCLNNDDNLFDTDEGRGGVCVDNDGAYTCECDDIAWTILADNGLLLCHKLIKRRL